MYKIIEMFVLQFKFLIVILKSFLKQLCTRRNIVHSESVVHTAGVLNCLSS